MMQSLYLSDESTELWQWLIGCSPQDSPISIFFGVIVFVHISVTDFSPLSVYDMQ